VQTIAYPKEQMHRIAYTKLTETYVGAKLAARLEDLNAIRALMLVGTFVKRAGTWTLESATFELETETA
jgi:hypothetical protein